MKHKKNGFTLVELIVVLVILAVLAALLVPALTGYIDKARKSQVIAETRMLTQAAQTELSSLYATNEFAEQNKYAIFTVASKNDSRDHHIKDKVFQYNLFLPHQARKNTNKCKTYTAKDKILQSEHHKVDKDE